MLLLVAASLVGSATGRAAPDATAAVSADTARDPIVTTCPGSAVEYELGDAQNLAYVQRDRLDSVDVQLRRRGSRLDGRIKRLRVELELNDGQIVGVFGDRSISLRTERLRGQLRIDGMFGARAIALTLDPQALLGEVGLCRFSLAQRRGSYVGHVFCGGDPLRVRLTIPVSLAARGDVELAAMLTSLLVA
ncbi:MAG TPA: hypothetical protein VHJ20_12250 [Polyangia bacterium]|nr:hypothetical protein [Polyangia bacterium]